MIPYDSDLLASTRPGRFSPAAPRPSAPRLSARLWIGLLAALLLLGVWAGSVHAQESWNDPAISKGSNFQFLSIPWGSSGGFNLQGADWTTLAFIAIAICLSANTLVYVAGKVLELPALEHLALSEFYQASASAMLVVGIAAIVSFSFGFLASSHLLPQGENQPGVTVQCQGQALDVWKTGPFDVLKCKIEEKIAYAESLFSQAYAANQSQEVKSSTCVYLFGTPIWCGDWDSETHANMERAHYVANRVVPIAIALHGQYMFMDYLAENMLNIFLPLGILLRIFPPLRGIGGLFIAIAIGFYFVFPVSYIILDPSSSKPDPHTLVPVVQTLVQNACFTSFSGIVDVATSGGLLLNGNNGSPPPAPDINQLGSVLTTLQIEAFFYPLAALGATLLFINAIAPTLGGDTGNMLHFMAKMV